MEWIDKMNGAIDYIEAHLAEEVDYADAARVACCSVYHFQRMFGYMAGIPLSEYIRRRRMSLAAAELQSGDSRIVDVALKYGYASPTAFNRAFQSVHGVAPSLARKEGVSLRAYPPIRFVVTVKGAEELNYRIEKKGAFRIVGAAAPLDPEIENNFAAVPALWQRVAADGTLPRLAALMEGPPAGLLGVSACNTPEDWTYYIAVATGQPAPEGLAAYDVPAFTWAVFPGTGTNLAIQELERRIVTEWLPTSGYEYANGPDVEVYLSPDPDNAVFEVWIPVEQKKA